MPASNASASSETPRRVLVCGVNWIGDAIMSMPALQSFRRYHPNAHIALLVKDGIRPLWTLHSAPDELLCLRKGLGGTVRTARAVARLRFDVAYIQPHSFRSALIPFLAGVPARVGMPGHARDRLLTEIVHPRIHAERYHQAYELCDLMLPDLRIAELETPRLTLPPDLVAWARERTAALPTPRVGMLPGAARGPSKQWPAAHFVELGKRLRQRGAGCVILGGPSERTLCAGIAREIGGDGTIDLSGETTLPRWAAVLASLDAVVANDSGGMHLAAAVGAPIVALYGLTDPRKTGPLGTRCRILQSGERRARDIRRHDPEAERCLAGITPEMAFEAVQSCL